MATMTVSSSKWNVGKDTSKLSVDPRVSVCTWSSTRYTPSVITFNANWAPAPLSAPAPLQVFSSSATSPSGVSPSCWGPVAKPYLFRTERPGPSSVPAEALDSDDGERVSHLDFDSDSDGDSDGVENKDEGRRRRRRRVRYGWHGVLGGSAGEQEDNYRYEREEEDSTEPTPTQERTNFAVFLRPSSRNTDYSAPLRAYLASYGFPNGLGYEHPPPEISYRSSTPSSRYSFHGESKPEDGSDNTNNNIAHDEISSRNAYSYRPCQSGSMNPPPPFHSPRSTSLLAPSAWPTSLNASSTLLTSLALDSTLVDDPCTAWETLCWDEAAPESESDSETDPGSRDDNQEGQRSGSRTEGRHYVEHESRDEPGLVYRAEEKVEEESWRESSPSPVFRRRDELTETDFDTEDEGDDRTISNATWNEATTTSPGTSTTSTEDAEEWISLTGARAQAARARILPYRHLQVPLPTYPQTDVSALSASLDTGRTERTPVDPVLARTPPVLQSVTAHDEAGASGALGDPASVSGDLSEMLANTSAEGAAEGETAPDYGECERDRLVLAERDPPPYDLAYDSSYTPRPEDRMESIHGGASEENQLGGPGVSSSSTSQNQLQSQPQVFTQVSTTRVRSQLSFPTSPTETDSFPATSMSPTSAFPSQPTPLFSTSPISPATTDATALITPAATQFSAFPYAHPYRDSSKYSNIPSSSKFVSQLPHVAVSNDDGNESRPNSPPYLFPQGNCTVYPSPQNLQNQMKANQRPRPLPPRPTGPGSGFGLGGTRTTAEAWLSASAAGPYATGSASKFGSISSPTSPASGSRVGAWNAFGYGSGSTTNLGSGLGISPESRSPPPVVGVRPASKGGDRDGGVDRSGAGTPARRSDENGNSGKPTVPQRSLSERPTRYHHHHSRHLQQHHYPYALNRSSAASERSLSTESFVVLDDSDSDQENDNSKSNENSFGPSHAHSINLQPAKEDGCEDKRKDINGDVEEEEKGRKHSLGSFHSSSETTFQIITSRIKSEVDGGIGKVPISSHHPHHHLHHIHHAQNRSRSQRGNGGGSGSGKALRRLATRCSTLTRRIGIVTGVGGVGRDR